MPCLSVPVPMSTHVRVSLHVRSHVHVCVRAHVHVCVPTRVSAVHVCPFIVTIFPAFYKTNYPSKKLSLKL